MNIQKELIKYQSETAKRFKPKDQDYNKPEMTYEVFRLKSCNDFRAIEKMPYGKERRQQLLNWLNTQTQDMHWHIPYGFIVNRRYQLIIKKDPDLQYLIKKGILVQLNKKDTRYTTYNYLVLSDKYNNGQLKQGEME